MNTEHIEDLYPLSPMQQGMLFHSLYAPEAGAYFHQLNCTLRGKLSVPAFERAWQQAVDKHSTLRTCFIWEDVDEPVQVVFGRVRVPFQQVDWRDLSSVEKQECLESLLQADRNAGFDLSQAPLMRMTLITMADDEYHFIWSIHHLLMDGWSTPLLFNDVFAFYDAYCQEKSPTLKPCPPYKNYIAWLQQQDISQAESFWRNTLEGFTSPTPLASLIPNAATDEKFQYAEERRQVSRATIAALRSFARRQQLTINTVIQGAWGLLLSRYSGERDVVFGATVSGRPAELEGVESMMGLFINTLPVRVRVNEGQMVEEWLREIQEQQVEARQYEYSPLVKVGEWSEVGRGRPLFESIVVFENYPVDRSLQQMTRHNTGLEICDVRVFKQETYPLILTVASSQLSLSLTYNQSRFDPVIIGQMMQHFERLIEEIVADPQRPVSRLPMMSESERRQLLVEWNDTSTDYPRHSTIDELFEAQVRHSPESISLAYEGGELSYDELNRRANRLAHYLRRSGVGPEVCVGICLRRGVDMIVSMLAILKAGGAYVPLDPTYPLQRLMLMLEQSTATVVLSDEQLSECLPSGFWQVISLDSEREQIERCNDEDLPTLAEADNLAYVMYTSGTTGGPKGVGVTHRGVVRLVKGADYVRLGEQEVMLQMAPATFDASTFEIWGSLLNGGRLALMADGPASLREIGEAVSDKRVTTLWLTAGLFQQMVEEEVEGLRGVRQLLAGGDVLPARQALKVIEELEGCELINGYGPTENTTFTCCRRVEAGEAASGRVAIGRPISNTRVYVLDEEQKAVPVGVEGELYIAGEGLARCYINRAEETAEKFVPNPYGERGGERMYRSGDRARWLANGVVEYAGRKDGQVKVRGYRIELREVESVIRGCSEVSECVVVVREGEAADKRLVAYVVAEGGEEAIASMKEHVKRRLPEYMVPSAVVLLDKMPLTANGKLDRRALPEPAHNASRERAGVEGAKTAVEEIVCGIWEEVLRVEGVARDDNFFEIGGHSLLATQVVSRVREAFKVEVALREVFENPTIAEFAAKVEEAMRAGEGAEAIAIERVDRSAALPLSYAQQRLWFLNQLEPESAAYNMPVAIRMVGNLDVAALNRALTEVITRHETLRTVFDQIDGQPVQVIEEASEASLPVIDLSGLDQQRGEQEAMRLAVEEAERCFDLRQGPLLRVSLVRLGEGEQVLMVTMHHIVSDGWSVGVLISEVSQMYEAYSEGRRAELPALPVQYADYAMWQRRWLSGEVLDAQLAYWRQQLATVPPVLQLPTDRPRPPVQSYAGASQYFAIDEEVTAKLRSVCRREGVTLYMMLMAVFQMLLSRYSGQQEVVVGSPIANRTRKEVEGLIGFFVNTLVIRSRLERGMSFRELLEEVRETTLGAYQHQELPFEKLVEEMQPERSLSHSPIFQVMFVLQNAGAAPLGLAGLELSSLGVDSSTSKFDLELSVVDRSNRLFGSVEYSTDLYDEETIKRMIGHLQVLLGEVITDTQREIRQLKLLTPAEEQQLLYEWNDSAVAHDPGNCFLAIFEQQVQQTPYKVAVAYQATNLSYKQLDDRANCLARILVARGVGPDVVVALLGKRDINLLTAILAVLKAGGAYLPLDPEHPPKRLSQVLSNSGTKLTLLANQFADIISLALDAMPAGVFPQVLEIDERIYQEGTSESLPIRNAPNSLAYVIYTSGSTGVPKGAMVEHAGMLNHLLAKIEALQLTSGDVVAQTASQCFDISVWQFLAPLLVGGRVHILDDEVARDPARLLFEVEQAGVSILETVPSMLRAMLDSIGSSDGLEVSLSELRWLLVTGEAFPPDLCHQWSERFRRVQLMNAYGPTECSDDVTHYVIEESFPQSATRVPIGKRLRNTRLYVLDPNLLPTPVGIPGELYVGGTGVGRGYLYDPERTAESFVPDPFAGNAGSRLYKTGDLVSYLSDGNIEYIGRIDHQVKLRGNRIELSEIEAVLSQHPQVSQAVVMVSEDGVGEKRLIGYVVADQDNRPTVSDLRKWSKEMLPEYMVPSILMFLNAMPLTQNGKVDRKALPAPEQTTLEYLQPHIAPRGPIEEVLAGIWAHVLKKESVSIDRNFFEIGGHSLLATQVVSRVREAFKVEVALREVFENPTIAEFAAKVEEAMRAGEGAEATAIERVDRSAALPLSYAQQRLWFLNQLEPESAAYNMPVAIRMVGNLDVAALNRALTEVITRHEALRTVFEEVDGQPVQVIEEASEASLPVIDLSGLDQQRGEQEAMRLAVEEAERCFDLRQGPLLRVSLVRLGEGEQVLMVTMHHIVSDGWSVGVLISEVSQMYEAYSEGRGAELPALPVQYADYAMWQRRWLSGEVLDAQLAYWKQQLATVPPVLQLPTDRPRPAVQSYAGATIYFTIDEELTSRLKGVCRREGVTLYMMLMAIFQMLLSRYSGQQEVVVGSPIANRTRKEVEGLIGFFVNTLVIRGKLERGMIFRELLEEVRETTLGAYQHQELPFEKLVEEMQPERSLSHSPIFQVMFVLQNVGAEGLRLRDITGEGFGGENRTSKFDLTLSMREAGERLTGAMEYSTDLFEAETIDRMITHLRMLLEEAADDTGKKIAQMRMLSSREQEQILVEWNDTRREYEEGTTLISMIERQALLGPEAVAVECGEQSLSYRELNRKANQLARHLRGKGVGPDVCVGLLVERGLDMAVGVLAILKTGGAYVPMDASYPQQRLAFMLEDSGARLLLTQQRLSHLFEDAGLPMVVMERDWEEICLNSGEDLKEELTGQELIYVIYTSGSTGKPKGIAMPHSAVANLISWHYEALSRGARTLAYSSLSFDASIHEVLSAWCSGGSVYIASQEERKDIELLGRRLEERSVEKAILPVVVMQQLAEQYKEKAWRLRELKEVITTGEQLKITGAVRELFSVMRWSRLQNHYGPSETHVVSWEELGEEADEWASYPAIGKPISNTQLYVLDEEQEGVPVGVEGELYIAGDGLARCYIGRAELTAEKFVPSPYGEGERMYRSGDRARWLANGVVEYIGRRDGQVKVRGYRIEVGEVEAVMCEQEGIKECAVVAREEATGGKRLVGYVVWEEGRRIEVAELKRRMMRRLPEHMVPGVYVEMEKLPLTGNGKVDRRALPEAEAGYGRDGIGYVGARNAAEEVVAGIWEDVLGIDDVGVYDNFFDLGGHSLLATQIMFRLREIFQVSVPLRGLFETPTVDGLVRAFAEAWGGPDIVDEIAQTFLEVEKLSQHEVAMILCKDNASE